MDQLGFQGSWGRYGKLKGGDQMRVVNRLQSIKKILKMEGPKGKIIFPLILAVVIYNRFQENSGL
jgi:hypothetical protein